METKKLSGCRQETTSQHELFVVEDEEKRRESHNKMDNIRHPFMKTS